MKHEPTNNSCLEDHATGWPRQQEYLKTFLKKTEKGLSNILFFKWKLMVRVYSYSIFALLSPETIQKNHTFLITCSTIEKSYN